MKTIKYEGHVGDVVNIQIPEGQITSEYNINNYELTEDESITLDFNNLKPLPYNYALTYGFDQQDSLVFSGFSSTKFIIFPQFFTPWDAKWSITFKVTTGSDVTTNQRVFSTAEGRDIYQPVLGLTGGHWKLWLVSRDSTTWDIANGLLSSSTVSPNTTYWLKLSWDGSTYKLEESLDNSSFTTVISVDSSLTIRVTGYPSCIGATKYKSSTNAQQPWLGAIDLSGISYEVEGFDPTVITRQVRLEDAVQSIASNLFGGFIYDDLLPSINGDSYIKNGYLYLYGNYTKFTQKKLLYEYKGKVGDIPTNQKILIQGYFDQNNNYPFNNYYLIETKAFSNVANKYVKNTMLCFNNIQEGIKRGCNYKSSYAATIFIINYILDSRLTKYIYSIGYLGGSLSNNKNYSSNSNEISQGWNLAQGVKTYTAGTADRLGLKIDELFNVSWDEDYYEVKVYTLNSSVNLHTTSTAISNCTMFLGF